MIDITAMMITGHQAERRKYALLAVRSFLRQTYDKSQLLIVNQGESLRIDDPRVVELFVETGNKTVGDLRNYALDRIDTPFVAVWDDDDWKRKDYLEYMRSHLTDDLDAVFLSKQIAYDWTTGKCYYRHKAVPEGVIYLPSASLVRNLPYRYPSLNKASDGFYAGCFKRRAVLDNESGIFVRTYHGLNIWQQKDIIDGKELPESKEVRTMLDEYRAKRTK